LCNWNECNCFRSLSLTLPSRHNIIFFGWRPFKLNQTWDSRRYSVSVWWRCSRLSHWLLACYAGWRQRRGDERVGTPTATRRQLPFQVPVAVWRTKTETRFWWRGTWCLVTVWLTSECSVSIDRWWRHFLKLYHLHNTHVFIKSRRTCNCYFTTNSWYSIVLFVRDSDDVYCSFGVFWVTHERLKYRSDVGRLTFMNSKSILFQSIHSHKWYFRNGELHRRQPSYIWSTGDIELLIIGYYLVNAYIPNLRACYERVAVSNESHRYSYYVRWIAVIYFGFFCFEWFVFVGIHSR